MAIVFVQFTGDPFEQLLALLFGEAGGVDDGGMHTTILVSF
jgi:hypothetical protein